MASLDCLVGCRVSSVVEVERFPSRRSPHSSLVDCTPAFSKLSRSWKLSSIWGRNLSLECSFSTERARDHRIDCATASSEQPKRPPTIFLLNSKPPRRRDEEPEERVASRREDDQNEEVGTSFEQGDYDNLKVEPDHKSGMVEDSQDAGRTFSFSTANVAGAELLFECRLRRSDWQAKRWQKHTSQSADWTETLHRH